MPEISIRFGAAGETHATANGSRERAGSVARRQLSCV